jgi:hypothetical protein
MSNKQKHQDLRNIYELLDKLCRKFSADRHKEILKTVTATIADSQQGFLSNLQFDESIIVTKIKNHLAVKNETNLSMFLNLHEELSTKTTSKFRSSILTLLLYLSDMESKLPNANNYNRESTDSVFTLPVRSSGSGSGRGIEPSASMEQIYRGMNRVSLSFHLSEFNLIKFLPERFNLITQFREQSQARHLPSQSSIINLV